MIERGLADGALLRDWFRDERPGFDALAGHVATTRRGRCWVDRSPDARAVVVGVAGNWLLRGDPAAVPAEALRPLAIEGFVDAPDGFVPALRAAGTRCVAWDRLVYSLAGPPRVRSSRATGARRTRTEIRRLGTRDAAALRAFTRGSDWVVKTWGGAAGVAASGRAWGAFTGGRLAALACTFFAGWRHEDIAVLTDPAARGQGLATGCAAGLCADIRARGRRPSWSTSTDNVPSQRVAEKIGFGLVRDDVLYVVNVDLPLAAPAIR